MSPGASSTTQSGSSGSGGDGGSGSGGGGGEGPTGTPLVVLNWNVRSLWNDEDDSDAKGEEVLSTAAYEKKLALVGAVLKELDPDVAVLQEVENEGVLARLNDDFLSGAYVDASVVESNDLRGVHIAALSKVPFDEIVSHKDDQFTALTPGGPTYKYTRDCVELHLTVAERKLVLLGVHFRSKGPPDDADKRLAEAQHTRAIADGLAKDDPDAGILVLGDFNDLPGSPPYQAVLGTGEDAYTNAPLLIPSEDRWTFDYQGKLELIDHQMANPVLAEMLDEKTVRIRHGDDVACDPADPECASDHAPLVATYRIR